MHNIFTYIYIYTYHFFASTTLRTRLLHLIMSNKNTSTNGHFRIPNISTKYGEQYGTVSVPTHFRILKFPLISIKYELGWAMIEHSAGHLVPQLLLLRPPPQSSEPLRPPWAQWCVYRADGRVDPIGHDTSRYAIGVWHEFTSYVKIDIWTKLPDM